MSQTDLKPAAVDAATRVYCVIGHPVFHSKSPVMHNQAFAAAGYPAVYTAFDVTDIAAAVAGIRALGICGASVTIPHKISVMKHLDELDSMAEKTGAVNTIVNNKGRLKGYNTDGYGAVWALMDKTEISNKTVLIVGAGGAARAVAFGLCQHPDTKIFITNRTEINGQILARELGAKFVSMEKLDTIEFDILVNTTPVGMFPYTDEMPVDQSLLRPELVVMDIVYNPLETKLLYTAKTRGCKVIDGVGMFVYQGARQFALWTAMEPPVDQMRQAVYDTLSKP